MTIAILAIPNDRCPVDKLLYQKFGGQIPGLLEAVYALNPGLAALGPFPPRGTKFRVDSAAAGAPPPLATIVRLYD